MNTLRPSLKLSWRVGVGYTEDDEHFARLLKWIEAYPTLVDEVALFESYSHHLYIPLDEYAERCRLLARRLDRLRGAGIASVGINVLTTIGHTDEAWDYLPPLPFQPMIDESGRAARGSACPNSPELRAYIAEKYRLTAEARPDFIWVDDDLRMQHHQVDWPCFCDTCLKLFDARTGRLWRRPELRAALVEPDQGELRDAWVQQNSETLASLLADVREAVRGVNPAIELGLMTAGTVWASYSGPDHPRWFTALGATKSRPGGGFYRDDPRGALIGKAMVVGQQRAQLPPTVTDCQYELENFPYQKLHKSATTVVNECTMALAMGLNGIAHNWLHMWGTSDADTLPLLAEAARWRPVWEQLVAWTAGAPTVGLREASTMHIMARRDVRPGESWFAQPYAYTADLLAQIGLPFGADEPFCATVLRGRMAEGFTDDELRAMLAGGLILDSTALEVLERRGLGSLCGVRLAERRDNGLLERFTDDPLNEPYVGERRDARIEFWGNARGQADVLEPLGEGVRVLAVLEDFMHHGHGACMTAYEGETGGRVVAIGYAPWMFLFSAGKREQLLNVADWVARGTVPVRIQAPEAVTPVVRWDAQRGKGAVVLLNWGLDCLHDLPVELRLPPTRVRAISPDGEAELVATPMDAGMVVTLPDMRAWSVAVLLLG